MGTQREYKCDKCGFTISNWDLNYFLDEETDCIIEHASGMLTFDMGYDTKIKGRVILSFCPDCSSEVHFYYNDNESYVKEIKSSLNSDENDFKELLDEKYPLRIKSSVLKGAVESKDKKYAKCPKCGNNIAFIEDECECPKCDGKLHSFSVLLYD